MSDEQDYVPLLKVLEEVRKHRAVEDEVARNIIAKAHIYGDLDFKKRRPDGSFEDLVRDELIWLPNPYGGATVFDEGVIIADRRMPRSYRRRVRPEEPCRIYGIRENLDSFLGVSSAPQEGGARRLGAPQTAPVKKALVQKAGKQNKRDRAKIAIKALWPNRVPSRAEMPDGMLCQRVIDWLKADCKDRNLSFVPISNATILRAVGRKQ